MLRYSKLIVFNVLSILALVLINTSLSLLLPLILSKFIDGLSSSTPNLYLIIFYLLVSIALLITTLFQRFFIEKISWNTINKLRLKMINSILNQREDFFLKYSNGDLLEYFEVDIDKLYIFLSTTLPILLSNIISIIIIVTYLSTKSLYILIFFLIYLLFDVVAIKLYQNKNQQCILDESNFHEEMDGQYSEWLEQKNLPSILGRINIFTQKFSNLQDKWLKYRINTNKYYYSIWCISLILNTFVDIFMLLIGGVLFFNKLISLGNVYLFYSYGKRIQYPMESMQQQLQFVVKCFYSLKRLDNILKLDVKETSKLKNIENSIQTISLKNLSFSYDKDIKVLNNINLTIKSGDIIGIYGKSGDGKSTLCKLLLNTLKTNEPMIFIDGCDLQEINEKFYLKRVIHLENDPMIIEGTLYENLTMFDYSIKKSFVHKKAQEYEIYNLINHNVDIDFKIIPEHLSHGQKQIIALCRILFNEKDLIILDEAFSDVNIEDTLPLMNKIFKYTKDKIFILVSHQLDKLSLCTKLYEIKGGNLYEKPKC